MQNKYKWIILSSTSLAVLLVTLNSGTLIIALPLLMRELHASLISILWVVIIYMLSTSVLMLNIGRLSDIMGRRTLYNWGFVIFTAASLFSGLSSNVGELIIFRGIQGIGGSLLMGIGTALITDAFPSNQRGTALGINSMVAAVGQMAGPIVGGLLVGFGWKWVFWFNVPIGIAATIWSYLTLKETGIRDNARSFDIPGTAVFLTGIVSLLVVLSFAGIYGWRSLFMILLAALAVCSLAAFLWIERRTKEPLLDLSLFRDRIFSMGNLSALLNAMSRMAVTFLLTFYFQGARGYSALEAGFLLTPLAASMFLVAPLSGWFADHRQTSWLSALGLGISCIGLAGLAGIQVNTHYWELAAWMCLLGGGSGFFNSPNTSAVMGTVPAQKRGVAAGIRSTMVNIGMMVSMALALAVTTGSMSKQTMMRIFADQKVQVGDQALSGFIHGLHNAFWVSAGLALLATFASLMRNRKNREDAMP